MEKWTNTWQPEIYELQGSYISGCTNPGYNVLAVEINMKYLEETLGDYLSAALVKEIWKGEYISAFMVVEK